jgi:hypothetical protein
MIMNLPEENENNAAGNKEQDPSQDVETVVSKNDNMEPVPDEEQLNEKKE